MNNNTSIGYFLFENLLIIISKNYNVSQKKLFSAFQEGIRDYRNFIFLQDEVIDNDIDWVSQIENSGNILAQSNKHYKNAIFSLLKVFPADH